MDVRLIPAGKEEEQVVNIHPRTMFIPQEGWSFLSAGKTRSNSVPAFSCPVTTSDGKYKTSLGGKGVHTEYL